MTLPSEREIGQQWPIGQSCPICVLDLTFVKKKPPASSFWRRNAQRRRYHPELNAPGVQLKTMEPNESLQVRYGK